MAAVGAAPGASRDRTRGWRIARGEGSSLNHAHFVIEADDAANHTGELSM
jgi:hypothetical protein